MVQIKETFASLHNQMALLLLAKVESGEATSADLSVARQLLKDNGIDQVAFQDSPIANLAAVLPFEDEERPVAQGE